LPRRLFLATHERTEVHSREVARSSLSPLASGPGVHFEEWLASGPTRALAAKPGGGQRAGKPSRSPLLRRARRLGSVRAGKPPGLPSRAERVERPLPLCGSGIARLDSGGKEWPAAQVCIAPPGGKEWPAAQVCIAPPSGAIGRHSRRVVSPLTKSGRQHKSASHHQGCDRSPLTVRDTEEGPLSSRPWRYPNGTHSRVKPQVCNCRSQEWPGSTSGVLSSGGGPPRSHHPVVRGRHSRRVAGSTSLHRHPQEWPAAQVCIGSGPPSKRPRRVPRRGPAGRRSRRAAIRSRGERLAEEAWDPPRGTKVDRRLSQPESQKGCPESSSPPSQTRRRWMSDSPVRVRSHFHQA